MREIRQSGSEGGVAVTRHPYPYDCAHRWCRGGGWRTGVHRFPAPGVSSVTVESGWGRPQQMRTDPMALEGTAMALGR